MSFINEPVGEGGAAMMVADVVGLEIYYISLKG
jgi:hypothetical protein